MDTPSAIAAAMTGGLPAWSLAVICPLLFAAGFVDAIGGGGGLVSLPAYLICGLPAHQAIGTNKLSSTLGTAVATFKYARSGYVDARLSAACVVTALAGSALGSHLALRTDERALTWFMLFAIPVVAFYVLRGRGLDGVRPALSAGRTLALALAIAFGLGVYDGFYGPGTGTFLLLALTGLARLDVFKAAGVTKVINLTTNATALVVFLSGGVVLVGLGLVGGVCNIVGNYLGASMFSNRGAAIVRPVILVVLVVFAARTVAHLAGVL